MNQFAAVSILVLTLALALWRPVILRWQIHHVHAALLGAALMVLLNIVPLPLATKQIFELRYPFITIVSLMIVTTITDRIGLFDLLAHSISNSADGDPRKLFTYLYFTGAAVGTFFTNDAAVLIFTPLVINVIATVQEDGWTNEQKLPYYFAVLYVANVVAVLVISNPIDIIVCDMFGITFLEYATWNALPGIVSIVVSYFGLRIAFAKVFPKSFRPMPKPEVTPRQRQQMIVCGVVLGVTLVGLFLQQFIGLPTWLLTLIAAAILLFVYATFFRSDPVEVVRNVGWDVLIFVAGMFVIATGIRNLGITEQLAEMILSVSGDSLAKTTTTTGFSASVLSAIMNNHPTALTMGLVIKDMDLAPLETQLTAFAALMGGDLGPKMLPTGSLAAMLWFRILRNRGVEVSYLKYVKLGIPITLVALACSLLTLNLQYQFLKMFE